MINFYLPNFYEQYFYHLNLYFINTIKYNPEYFYDNIKIGALYGTFPGIAWNGGRIIHGGANIQSILNTIQNFNQIDIPLRFTYTNICLTEEHLKDEYALFVTKLAENGQNEILVNSPLLEEFLRKNFPNYKYLSSTTKCLLDEKEIETESNKYYLTVLDYRKNIDLQFLSNLSNPEKYELLINAYCDPNCTQRMEHYEILSKGQLDHTGDIECSIRKKNFFESLEFPTVIKVEDLYNIYVPMGFNHFKIEGRTNHVIDVLESYIYYMVKPEYHTKIRYEALKSVW